MLQSNVLANVLDILIVLVVELVESFKLHWKSLGVGKREIELFEHLEELDM